MAASTLRLAAIDLDGTLADTVADIADSVDMTMTALQLRPHGIDKVKSWIGNGIPTLLRRALADSTGAAPDDDLYLPALSAFNRIYAENLARHSRLYPGVAGALDKLRGMGLQLSCVTNKHSRFTLPLLKSLGIYSAFDLVVSGGDLPKSKPHPMPLLHAANTLHIDAGHAVMIGDSNNDIAAGRAAGFYTIGVTYGYSGGTDIKDTGADRVVESFADIPAILSQL
ncbi:phosphoglycolate phosphatase [Exilibacterium tricleocarpae]|uniref:Phosphoglycolate phosphatase n=1 Tax=Exilibacterium tricleocarpae TaxID=2591008 RepID=A0A545TLT5_9GAMM|nr:phosphoglycolate phosphatase [Exilibacterium tricleocarpae]TQV78200.1 phosphoglycolate phosphatase [Exilibacterium tricleocarpae]